RYAVAAHSCSSQELDRALDLRPQRREVIGEPNRWKLELFEDLRRLFGHEPRVKPLVEVGFKGQLLELCGHVAPMRFAEDIVVPKDDASMIRVDQMFNPRRRAHLERLALELRDCAETAASNAAAMAEQDRRCALRMPLGHETVVW